MKKELFAELMSSAQEALEHAKGRKDLRTTVLPSPPKPMSSNDVKRLRKKLNASQTLFASWLNVSTKLVQAWEADRRSPEGPALRLLRLAEKKPQLIFTQSDSAERVKAAAKKKRVYKKAAPRKAAKKSA